MKVKMDDSKKASYGAELALIRSNSQPHKVIGKCPRCGGDIIEGKAAFGCSNWRQGCKFVIWKQSEHRLWLLVNMMLLQSQQLD